MGNEDKELINQYSVGFTHIESLIKKENFSANNTIDIILIPNNKIWATLPDGMVFSHEL